MSRQQVVKDCSVVETWEVAVQSPPIITNDHVTYHVTSKQQIKLGLLARISDILNTVEQ